MRAAIGAVAGDAPVLDQAGVAYEVNPRLVRGLDYYCKTVFEWVTDALGAQGTVCAGGRYDGLVEQLGGKSTPAVGFAMGVERLVLLLETLTDEARFSNHPDFYVMGMGEAGPQQALLLAETVRTQLPKAQVLAHCGGGKFKKQMKKADDSGASYALILGEDEIANNTVGVKFLREEAEQITLPQSEIADYFKSRLNG